jgi:hypothetical protein
MVEGEEEMEQASTRDKYQLNNIPEANLQLDQRTRLIQQE